MPLYPYFCSERHETEYLCLAGETPPPEVPCGICGEPGTRGVGIPAFVLSWARAPIDTFKEAWEGTGLENKSDGVNPLYYKSKKAQVDLGKKAAGAK